MAPPEALARHRYIAIEGAIGVGKTTLAARLAPRLGARLLLERPEENPFLERFYADRARYALPTQLSFLFQRLEQARELTQSGIFAPLVVSDFMFAKDELFARLTLSDDEYRLYRRIGDDFASFVPQPDLIVWLRAPSPTLVERIGRRGRAMERGLETRDLDDLDAQYAAHFARHPRLPVMSVDTSSTDFSADEQALDALIARMGAFEPGRGAETGDA